MEGVRFLFDLLANYRGYQRLASQGQVRGWRIEGAYQTKDKSQGVVYDSIVRELDDPNTKRILFDSRQAVVFTELGLEGPPKYVQSKLKFPFPHFYMEFTEPIRLAQEPGFDDLTRAVVITQDVMTYDWLNGQVTGNLSQVTVFQTAVKDKDLTYVDRSFKVDLAKGWVMVPIRVFKELGLTDWPTEMEGWKLEHDDYQYWPIGMRLRRLDEGGFDVVQAKPEDWIWFEKAVYQEATLLYWCLAYMMAKSVVIVEEDLPRHERRRLIRQGELPKPWHVVKVDPKVVLNRHTSEEIGTKHRYRYDVIGHLRFGHHPRKDGSYSDTIEWVAPHQRGLASTLYIPKTYKVEQGRMIAQPMIHYFQEGALDEA